MTRPVDEVALAFLATPTDVFAVPAEAVEASVRNYAERRTSKLLRVPLRTVSGGRLLRRNYVPGEDPGINDSPLQQGPNYLLAKRLQRWRAASARAEGATVSFNVAPPTRTRSVVKNRALAAAYAGAHRFGIEVYFFFMFSSLILICSVSLIVKYAKAKETLTNFRVMSEL